ncbi:MAG: hypothetical protein AAFO69_03470 [Bacteroidota bacterium]
MKVLLTLVITLLTVLTCFGQNGRIEIHPTDNITEYKLLYMADMSSDVVITVLKPNGQRLSEQTVEDKKGFSYTVDLAQQNSGTYYVEIFTPFYTLYDTIGYVTKLDRLKEVFTGEVLGNKIILTTNTVLTDDEFRLVINEDDKEIISDQIIRGSEFGMRVFDFNDSEAEVTNVSIYYKGNRVKTWAVSNDTDL